MSTIKRGRRAAQAAVSMSSTASPAQVRARIALAAAMAVAALWIGQAFVPAVLWAGVVAVAVDPLMSRLDARFPGKRTWLSAGLVAVIAFIVMVPLAVAATRALGEAQSVTSWYAGAKAHGIPVPAWVSNLPYGSTQVANWWKAHLVTAAGAAQQMAMIDTAVIAKSRSIGHTVIERAVVFAFSLVITFFLLRDRSDVVAQLERASLRAFGDAGPRLGRQIMASVRGTVDGLVLLGVAQAVVMAIMFAVAGVPHPILLGALAGFASVVPFGLIAVLLVAAALLAVNGAVGAAITITAIGVVINFSIDHFIRPGLIGGATRLPFVWVLIGIVGGVETIGLLGLFVGPAVMAALVMIWREWVGEDAPGNAHVKGNPVTTTDTITQRPQVGDMVSMFKQSVVIEVAEVPEAQPRAADGFWDIIDQYGEHHVVEYDADRWFVVVRAI